MGTSSKKVNAILWDEKYLAKWLTLLKKFCIIIKSNGDVAQLARAFGSYPECQEFESPRRYQLRGFKSLCFYVVNVKKMLAFDKKIQKFTKKRRNLKKLRE